MRFGTRILRKTLIKLINGSAKGPCGPKTGQKVAFLEGEKGFSKNPFSKGISHPKIGLKRAKGLSGPTLLLNNMSGIDTHNDILPTGKLSFELETISQPETRIKYIIIRIF